MSTVLLVSASASTSVTVTKPKAALESKGHTVVYSLAALADLNAAWANNVIDVILLSNASYTANGQGQWQAWVRDKWAQGVPLILGGIESGMSATSDSGFGEQVGMLTDQVARDNTTAPGVYGAFIYKIAEHPVMAGFPMMSATDANKFLVSPNWISPEFKAPPAAYGTALAEIKYGAGSGYGLSVIAFERGQAINPSAVLSPGGLAPARAVYLSWLYPITGEIAPGGVQTLDQAVNWVVSQEPTPPETNKLLLLTKDLTGFSYINTKSTLESLGYSVVGTLSTRSSAEAAWVQGGFKAIVLTSIDPQGAVMTTFVRWLRDRWVTGTDLIFLGVEYDSSSTSGAMVQLGLFSAIIQGSGGTMFRSAMGAFGNHPSLGIYSGQQTAVPVTTNANWSFRFDPTKMAPGAVLLGKTAVGTTPDTHATAGFGLAISKDASLISGASNVSGLTTAPANAVAFGWSRHGTYDYTPEAVSLIHSAIEWAAPLTTPPPEPTSQWSYWNGSSEILLPKVSLWDGSAELQGTLAPFN